MVQIGDYCIILTGCITPDKNVYKLAISDPEVRRNQVKEAIVFFLEKSIIKKVVYCDNSYAKEVEGLAELAQKHEKEFEWLSFKGNSVLTRNKGKGYGEGEIVEYAINNSKLIASSKYIIKLTGRLRVLNINAIMKHIKSGLNYFDISKSYVDTRFYIVSVEKYEELFFSVHQEVDDKSGVSLERIFQKIILQNKLDFKPFPIAIKYSGVSGSMGIKYEDSFISIVKKTIKSFLFFTYWNIKYRNNK